MGTAIAMLRLKAAVSAPDPVFESAPSCAPSTKTFGGRSQPKSSRTLSERSSPSSRRQLADTSHMSWGGRTVPEDAVDDAQEAASQGKYGSGGSTSTGSHASCASCEVNSSHPMSCAEMSTMGSEGSAEAFADGANMLVSQPPRLREACSGADTLTTRPRAWTSRYDKRSAPRR